MIISILLLIPSTMNLFVYLHFLRVAYASRHIAGYARMLVVCPPMMPGDIIVSHTANPAAAVECGMLLQVELCVYCAEQAQADMVCRHQACGWLG